MKDMSRATFMKLAAAALGLTVIFSIVMVNIDWLGMDGSVEKSKIVDLLNVTIVLSGLVFSVVMVMMIYAIWKYRAKPGDESDGEPIHGNTKLEIIWTAIPTIIVALPRRLLGDRAQRHRGRGVGRRWRSTSPPSSSPGASTIPSRGSRRTSCTSRPARSSTCI